MLATLFVLSVRPAPPAAAALRAAARPPATRRQALTAAGAGALTLLSPSAALATPSNEELRAASRLPEAGVLRPSGLRVIDLVEGDGPLPALGDRVYVHIKVWGSSFDAGEPAYATWAADGRPSMWFLGEPSAVVVGPPYVPTTTVPAGIDEGVLGMREGGWRRLVVPASAAYGAEGLPRPGGRGLFKVPPNSPIFVDLRLVDGGGGGCDRLLRLQGLPKSISCIPGKI
mmetsp:Transcript_12594/g.39777  ORF Transcript_12594/g.39777 Transcript_12594/m.39777 type:complete len:229 (-) Transcript_12594:99-785(-)